MMEYTPQDLFEDPLIYELNDLVQGGLNGDANGPLKVLADRTQYLFKRQGLIEPKRITGNYTFDAADLGKAFAFHISANTTFNLPNVTTLVPGTLIRICTRIPVIKALTINCNGSQKIYDGSSDLSAMYMHDGERLWLCAASTTNSTAADHWEIVVADGNFFTAGESFAARKQMRNTIINDGCLSTGILHNRADMPRLWAFANSLGQGIVDDSVWLSDPGGVPVYRGCYSKGNGTTTFRGPDERGLQDRYLDLNRGLDNNRLYNQPGGYEPDMVGAHNHPADETNGNVYFIKRRPGGPGGGLGLNAVNGGWELQDRITGRNTGTETVGKNIGKIPLTKY